MKKLLAILFAAALLIFGATSTNLYASTGEEDEIPEVYLPMPY